ncbi:MAG: phosphatase PAP2 family protein [Lachnospiraceae bacterium]|nr:phosphatase PAP2 family protein [Lachnospiraceae bacterium]
MTSDKKVLMFFQFLLYSIAITIAVLTVDVAAIGPDGTKVGLSTINNWFRDLFSYDAGLGYSKFWYNITQIIGYFCLLVCVFWGCVGLYQLIKEKDINRVDKSLIATGVLYILTIIMYVVFEKCIVNYRPVIMEGETEVEASFPSSHTMLVIVVMGSTFFLVKYFLEEKENMKNIILLVRILCVAVTLLMVAGRLLSGVHWLSDIVAGIFISATLLSLYSFFADV